MREDTLWDKICSALLIAIPAVALILCMIPMYPMMDLEQYVMRNFLNPPNTNILTNICPMVLIVFVYTLILTICYYRSQALGTIKAIFVFSIVSLCVTGIALLPDGVMKAWPFQIQVYIWLVMCVFSFVRMKMEIKRYEDLE